MRSVTGVTDAAGDTFTELSSTTAPDGTVMTVWTAVVTYSGGTRPTITATTSAASDMGISVLEYAGLSTANGTAVLDSSASANGTTGTTAATISSGATAAAGHTNELALGFYADSGFSDTLTAGTGWTQRIEHLAGEHRRGALARTSCSTAVPRRRPRSAPAPRRPGP